MNTLSFEVFQANALRAGFDEVLERQWAPNAVIETHCHAFGVEAVVVQGDMWLSGEGYVRHLAVGDTFKLIAHEPHAERYGAQGATYWAARKNLR